MATATVTEMATTVLVPAAQNALSPQLPDWPVPAPDVGIKGGNTMAVTATVSPGVGVGAWKGESGSPVDETPVALAVTSTVLSTMFASPQAPKKAVGYICRRTRRDVSIFLRPVDKRREKRRQIAVGGVITRRGAKLNCLGNLDQERRIGGAARGRRGS
jgi:hypothetical protein